MCTVILLRRPDHEWPIILAANRDEMLNRAWQPPDRHWSDRPYIVAGLDEVAGGSWMGLNEYGVVACVLNRQDSLGPAENKRSRGELVLDALDHADAKEAADSLAHLAPEAFRPFNMVVTDNRDAYWIYLKKDYPDTPARLGVEPISQGVSMFTAQDHNDLSDPRIAKYLPEFQKAEVPDPNNDEWSHWIRLLGGRNTSGNPTSGMCFDTDTGFGTSSSALLALRGIDYIAPGKQVAVWKFAAGPPDSVPFEAVKV